MRIPALLASAFVLAALAGCNPKEPSQPNPPSPQTNSNELAPAQQPGVDTPTPAPVPAPIPAPTSTPQDAPNPSGNPAQGAQ